MSEIISYRLKNRDILYNDQPLGAYPDYLLKRVDKLTIEVSGPLHNWSHADRASAKALKGVLARTY